MRLLLMFLTLMATSAVSWANGKAYLDLEDDQIVSVFNKPGMNWKICANDPTCRAIAWPDNNAQIEVISPVRKMRVEDPYTGQIQNEEYVQIKYHYKRKVNGKTHTQEGQAWIDAAYVSKKKKNTFYGVAQSGDTDYCPPQLTVENGPKKIEKGLSALEKTLTNQGVSNSAKILNGHVGFCAVDPKNPPKKYASGNPYDTYVLPTLRKKGLPRLLKEDGSMMTEKDLIDIDALARTLYAEMAQCYKHGLQYPLSVAKVAFNRANNKDRHGEFIKDVHSSVKGPLAKVVTSPSQFSLWLKTIDGKKNNSLIQGLCPPSDKTKTFWTGGIPPSFETDIWDNTLKIATEAVLYPKQFNARTKQVKQYHYTSGMKGFYGMKQVFPWIEDRKVSKDACVQVWDEGKRT